MTEFIKMDIFFFVTTVVVLGIGILLILILMRVLKILGHLENVSRNVSQESELLRGDIAHLRSNIKEHGFKMRFFSNFFRNIGKRFTSKKKGND